MQNQLEEMDFLQKFKEKYSLENLLNNLPGVVFCCQANPSRTMKFLSAGCRELTGFTSEEILIEKKGEFSEVIHPDDKQQIWDKIKNSIKKDAYYQIEYRIIDINKQIKWVLEQGCYIAKNKNERVLEGFILDITQHKKNDQLVALQTRHDAVSHLPNRDYFVEELKHALAMAKAKNFNIAVLFIDIDDFKKINERYGRAVGDQFLEVFAHRIKEYISEKDFLARLYSDDFAIFSLREPDNIYFAGRLANRILRQLKLPFYIQDKPIFVTACIGISIFPRNGNNVSALMNKANNALNQAKRQEKNVSLYFNRDLHEKYLKRIQFENALRKAIKNNELYLLYQPKVSLFTGEIVGVEALLRWHNPELGEISPTRFIPIAEDMDIMPSFNNWVIEHVCRQIQLWNSLSLKNFDVAVNLNPNHLTKMIFSKQLKKILSKYQIDPVQLKIEITEQAAMTKDIPNSTFEWLKSEGLRLAIDDFGTGYSSLSRLHTLPIEEIKIDLSFIQAIGNKDVNLLIRLIVQLAKNLNITCVAEGIETQEQYNFLLNLGCEVGQGFYISRPVCPHKIERMLRKHKIA